MSHHDNDKTSIADVLDAITHANSDLNHKQNIYLFKALIHASRVNPKQLSESDYIQQVDEKIAELIGFLKENSSYQTALGKFLLQLMNQYNPSSVYTDIGSASNGSFFQKVSELIGHRVLPILVDDSEILNLVDEVFSQECDVEWLLSIDSKRYDELIDSIHVADDDLHLVATAKNNILNAMVILSQRISGMGVNNELMSKYPYMLNYASAFVAQSRETLLYVDSYRQLHQLDNLTDHIPIEDVNPDHLQVMLAQCSDIVKTMRKQIYKTGISVELVNLLLILDKSINRLNLLIGLLSNHKSDRDQAISLLLKSHVKYSKKRYSIWALINSNTQLLSQKITENASQVGEHYITTDKSGYVKMFKKAALGGLIIPIMATIKILSYEWSVAPLWRAVIDSFIYGFGFVFIHIIHGTVATKQPAMTAAAIASTISDSTKKGKHQLNSLSELIVDIIRSQTVAIAGNIMLAMPIALGISWLWFTAFGNPFVSDYKAGQLLTDLNPLTSLALPHAMLAGVFLFFSGLVAGYYDNFALRNKVGARIARHKLLMRWLPTAKVTKFANYIQDNLGALMSNFSFGMLLGSTGTIGYILGLPLDIRHIAFASANMAHGLFNLDISSMSIYLVLISALGVILIGTANLIVSFSLALMVALRSKNVTYAEWGDLIRILLTHLVNHPLDFIIPRAKPVRYQHIDSDGYFVVNDKIFANEYTDKDNVIRQIRKSNIKDKNMKDKEN